MQQHHIIGIVGGEWFNKGSEAMLRTTMHELRVRIPNATFYIFVSEKKLVENHPFSQDASVIVVQEETGLRAFLRDVFSTAAHALTRRGSFLERSSNLSAYKELTATIDIHGYALHAQSLFRIPLSLACRAYFMTHCGARYFIFPQSIDYRRNYVSRIFVRFFLSRVEKIYVRGEASRENLRRMFGDRFAVNIVPDIAFLFESAAPDGAALKTWKDKQGRNLLGVSVNKRIHTKIDPARYRDILVAVIRYYVQKGTHSVVLIPHDVRDSKDARDLKICRDVYTALDTKTQEHVCLIDALDYTPAMYKWVVGQCDIVLASRFHVAVAALSQSIPTTVLGWSFKYRELFSWFGQESAVCDAGRTSAEALTSALDALIVHQARLSSHLTKCNHFIRRELDQFFDDIATCIR